MLGNLCNRRIILLPAVATFVIILVVNSAELRSSSTGTMPSKQLFYRQIQEGDQSLRFAAYRDKEYQMPVSVKDFWSAMQEQENSRHFTQILKDSPKFPSFFLETKGVSASNIASKQFEFVVVGSNSLHIEAESSPDPETFRPYLACAINKFGCAFANLGGDATLVAPKARQGVPLKAYSHIAAFVRQVPDDQVIGFWKLVSTEYLKTVAQESPASVWLSTEGSGVSWLHVRFDSRPKYYHYRSFANEN